MLTKLPVSESDAPADPKYYVWWFPGSPLKVHLDLQVIEGLQTRLGGGASATTEQGLLFGRVSDGATEIDDFQPASNRTVPEMIAEFLGRPGGRLLVGYYRFEQGMLRLNEADLSLFKQFFGKPYHVFLMVQPSAFAAPNATFFFSRSDHTMPEFPFLEFPLDAFLLATEERDRLSRCRQATEDPAITPGTPSTPVLPGTSSAPPRHSILINFTGRGILLAGLALLAMAISVPSFRTQASAAWDRLWKSPGARVSSSKPVSRIGLQARRQNSDLELSWNYESPWVTAATSGLISIQDGTSTRKIPLDSQQLRAEKILYSPTSDQILIQLSITTPAGLASESVRAILLKPEIATASPPQKVQSSSISVETPRRLEQVIAAQAVKPFTAPPAEKPRPQATASLPSEPRPANLHSDRPASLVLPPGLSQTPVLPELPRTAPGAPSPAPEQAPRLAIPQPSSPPVAYQPAIPLTKVAPIFPPNLKTLVSKPVTVAVRVSIDANGKVVKASALPQANVHQFFITEALHAVRLWVFQPARRGNEPVPSELVLQFVFRQ